MNQEKGVLIPKLDTRYIKKSYITFNEWYDEYSDFLKILFRNINGYIDDHKLNNILDDKTESFENFVYFMYYNSCKNKKVRLM